MMAATRTARWALLLLTLAGCDLDAFLDEYEVPGFEAPSRTRRPRRNRRRREPETTQSPTLPTPSPSPSPRPSVPSSASCDHVALGIPTDRSPQDDLVLTKPQYVLSYNRFRNAANWAAWRLSASDLGDTGRTRRGFSPDFDLPSDFYRPLHNDYRGSGYDHGHLCPSAQRTANPDDNAATFLMSNVLPQRHDMNAGAWEALESWSVTMARSGWDLYTYAGGHWPDACVTDRTPGGNPITPECLSVGRSDDLTRRIAVPDSMWKVLVLVPSGRGLAGVDASAHVIAVDMPNEGGVTHDWHRYQLSVDALEQRTGYDFLTEVPVAVQAVLEARVEAMP